MNILQVYQIFNPDVASGVSKVVYNVSRELVRRGHSVVVCTSDMKDKHTQGMSGTETVDGIVVHRFRTFWPLLARKFKTYVTPSLLTIFSDYLHNFDVVHLHGYRSFQNMVFYPCCKRENIPYVVQAHGSLPTSMAYKAPKLIYDKLLGYRLLRGASNVIALSQKEAQQYRGMGVPEDKIEIIPNGIDLLEYTSLPPERSFKKKNNIAEKKKIILYLGRIHKTKGIDFLVKAYAHLVKNVKLNDALLVIAGPEDGYLREAKSLADFLGLTDNVLFTGLLTEYEKKCVLVDSSLVVYPSPVEPFGLVALEAAASAKPIIVSNNTPMAAIIKTGKFGFSVEYGEIDQLAESMHKMLINDDLLKEMGQRGRKFVFENCDWAKIVTKLEKVYEEIAK